MFNEEECLQNYLHDLNVNNNLPNEIVAINFGIFESGQYEVGYQLYVMGSKRYDSHNDDWACFIDYTPEYPDYPLGFYGMSREVIQDFVQLVLSDYLKNMDFSQKLFSQVPHITIGFDDGNLIVIK
ncbi:MULTISPECIES: hypothetical protein [Moraxella]|uniref:hypothetical protein n=1 Tax=Moraxella sp. CTOTU49803 TaxID=2953840 RepID=UPI0028A05BB2|nr:MULTISPECIES: hypothetical protein [unclassified Moraxella]